MFMASMARACPAWSPKPASLQGRAQNSEVCWSAYAHYSMPSSFQQQLLSSKAWLRGRLGNRWPHRRLQAAGWGFPQCAGSDRFPARVWMRVLLQDNQALACFSKLRRTEYSRHLILVRMRETHCKDYPLSRHAADHKQKTLDRLDHKPWHGHLSMRPEAHEKEIHAGMPS